MDAIVASALELQRNIAEFQDFLYGEEHLAAVPGPRVEFSIAAGGLDLSYFGDPFDDDPSAEADIEDDGLNYPLVAFLDWLSHPEHAAVVRSLRFCGPDEGANGLRAWQFARLVNADVEFPRLHSFDVQLTDPGDHNMSVIASPDDDYAEDGTLAALLGMMPALQYLAAPSSPDVSFFDGDSHPLQSLRIQSGVAHQGFVSNFAGSSRFPELRAVDYAEVYDYIDLLRADEDELTERFTSFADFERLLASAAGRRIEHFTVRGTRLSVEELKALQAFNPDLQLLYVPVDGSRYISHLKS